MPVTSKQIAEFVGVSRGTVDRALHNRGRVNADVAERIRNVAKELGYQLSPTVRTTSNPKCKFKLGLILQSSETPIMQAILNGIRQAIAKLNQQGVEVIVREIQGLNTASVLTCIDQFIEAGIHGLALSASTFPALTDRITTLHQAGIPVVTFYADAPDSARVCYVGLDHYRAGQTAAELMRLMLPTGGTVLPLTGHLSNSAHNLRLNGFTDALSNDKCENLHILPSQACFDRDDFAYEITQHVLSKTTNLSAIYLTSNGYRGVCDAVRDAGKLDSVRIIAFDLTPANTGLLHDGQINLILSQDAFTVGYRSLFVLYNCLLQAKPLDSCFDYASLHIHTRYNADVAPLAQNS